MSYKLAGHATVAGQRWEERKEENIRHDIAVEVPLSLVYNGIAYAVMMVTPLDLEEFGLGFSISEGIIQAPEELSVLGACSRRQVGVLIRVEDVAAMPGDKAGDRRDDASAIRAGDQ